MSTKIFSNDRSANSVAYDIALALATKDTSVNSPEAMIQKIESLLPACLEVAQEQCSKEHPVIGGIFL